MSMSVTMLAIGFVLVAALLLSLNFYSRWNVWLKVVVTVLVGAFYVVNYEAINGLLGWPTTAATPDKFLLIASAVEEPNKETGYAGHIHLWAAEIRNRRPESTPRAYTLPYDEALHRELERAREGQRSGIPQIGITEQSVVTAFTRQRSGRLSDVRIHALPDPLLPEK